MSTGMCHWESCDSYAPLAMIGFPCARALGRLRFLATLAMPRMGSVS